MTLINTLYIIFFKALNSVEPDQLASDEASQSGSTLFFIDTIGITPPD